MAKRRLWEEGLRRELLALDRAGIRVLLLQPAPQATVSVESCSILRLRLGRCGGSFSRAAAESALAPLRRVQLAATAGLTHVHVLDLVPALCGARTCPFRVDGQYLYRDIGHLSLQGAHYVTPAIERAVHGVLIHDTT